MNSGSIIHVVNLKENTHPNIAVSYPAYTKCRKPRIGGPQYTFSITTKTPITNNNNNKNNSKKINCNRNNNAPFRNTSSTNANSRSSTGAVPTFQNRKAAGFNTDNIKYITTTRMHTLYGPVDWRECTSDNACTCPLGRSSRRSSQYRSPQKKETYVLNAECQRPTQVPQPSSLGNLTLEDFLSQSPLQQKFSYKLRSNKRL
ncbi:serine/threonine-protein kinase pakE [Octopus bimaculoides]|uniref:Uncharacterized protein n=1 Tax=Octopus bimaculoides TaxID=37653 RepID=A0A0L8FNJ6_OCTBM|nr:serine/threonine-protein kinase pakE [Octopus bimaculoides]XP_052833905.1 serine/threonine-protein kinase pakE [Octopus bimaculoides]XP_052833906.1 serine/threonine-protein kinase pakE [Octopus bimaculoides]|eukprot:XP_014788464.1 PREDICTED: serine/threonine-protein kinase pakE-like [Octopus bimaculoides]